MAGNVYGKIDCSNIFYSNEVDTHGNEMYVNLFNFLTYLSGNNVVDLVTYFTGSLALGSGTDYWDTANRCGQGAFSVWKWKANANRNWDWYMMIQNHSGSSNLQINANCTPTLLGGGTFYSNAKGILMQIAISVSGSISYNPWNGTISMGNAAKTTPVWVTGSNPSASLHVFPRTNNISGSDPTAKSTVMIIGRESSNTSPVAYRAHFLADSDSLVMFSDHANNIIGNGPCLSQNYFASYYGPFKLIPGISQSNIVNTLGQSGSLGFVSLTSIIQNSTGRSSTTIPEYTNIGPITTDINSYEGGLLATTDIGVRRYFVSNDNTSMVSTYNPNSMLGIANNELDERMFSLILNENPYYGFAGWLDTPLFRNVVNINTHHVRYDGLRAVFGGTTVIADRKISTVWSGSNPPGAFWGRTGYNIFVPSSSII